MNRATKITVRNLTELGAALREHTARYWNVAPTDKDGDDSKDHGEGKQPHPQPEPQEPQPDDHIIERTLPSRKPIGPTDI